METFDHLKEEEQGRRSDQRRFAIQMSKLAFIMLGSLLILCVLLKYIS